MKITRTIVLDLLTEAEALSVEWDGARGGKFLMSLGKLYLSLSADTETNLTITFPSDAEQLGELITTRRYKEVLDIFIPVLRSLEEQTRDNRTGRA